MTPNDNLCNLWDQIANGSELYNQFSISIELSPFCIFTDFPALTASGIFSITENISSSPTAVSTLPSITPVGGIRNPAPIRQMLDPRVR